MIKLIEINKIHPHPDNPRHNLGDLTELADSIKKSGILQNLTVVPMEGTDDEYYAIIGHRRIAAAELAGLKEVPCAIVEMDYKTQIATMLLENMQRSDLTVYEQAQGFQMMLDLGESVTDISDKTGFSESTVRRRMKLLELDQEKLKETMGRGATLMDYAELEKIEDLELRNEVLEAIGTSDFNWKLMRAIEEEEAQKKMAEMIVEIKKFATEIDDVTGFICEDSYYGASRKLKVPKDADQVEYFYKIDGTWIYIYSKGQEDEDRSTDKELEQKRELENERVGKLDALAETAYQLRYEFIKGYSNAKAKENIGIIIQTAIYVLGERYCRVHYEDIAEMMDIATGEDETEWEDISNEVAMRPELALLVATYTMMDNNYHSYFYHDGEYYRNKSLDDIYNLLTQLGYEMSEEEKKLQDGTHELFKPKEV